MKAVMLCFATILVALTLLDVTTAQGGGKSKLNPKKADLSKCAFEDEDMEAFLRGGKLVTQVTRYSEKTTDKGKTVVRKKTKRCFIGQIKLIRHLKNGTDLITRLGGRKLDGKGDFTCAFDNIPVPNSRNEDDTSQINGIKFSFTKTLTAGSDGPKFTAAIYVMGENGTVTLPGDPDPIKVRKGDLKWGFGFEKPAGCSKFICGDDGKEVERITVEFVVHCNVNKAKRVKDASCSDTKQQCYDMGGGAKLHAQKSIKVDGVMEALPDDKMTMDGTEDETDGGNVNAFKLTLDNDFTDSVSYDPLTEQPNEEEDEGNSSPAFTASILTLFSTFIMAAILQI